MFKSQVPYSPYLYLQIKVEHTPHMHRTSQNYSSHGQAFPSVFAAVLMHYLFLLLLMHVYEPLGYKSHCKPTGSPC